MGCVEYEKSEAASVPGDEARRAAEQILEALDRLRVLNRLQDFRIARDEGRHIDRFRRKGAWERADHVGKAPGLDERIDLGGDGKDAKRFHERSEPQFRRGVAMRLMGRACRSSAA
jgi:hypothetical protein